MAIAFGIISAKTIGNSFWGGGHFLIIQPVGVVEILKGRDDSVSALFSD
jgi:hypothetical protein